MHISVFTKKRISSTNISVEEKERKAIVFEELRSELQQISSSKDRIDFFEVVEVDGNFYLGRTKIFSEYDINQIISYFDKSDTFLALITQEKRIYIISKVELVPELLSSIMNELRDILRGILLRDNHEDEERFVEDF